MGMEWNLHLFGTSAGRVEHIHCITLVPAMVHKKS
jgi:hypothetical protein